MSLSSTQCRAARAVLRWSQLDLEAASRVAKKTIADFETDARQPYERTLDALRAALEKAGVEIIEDGESSEGGGQGARLKKPARKPRAKAKQDA